MFLRIKRIIAWIIDWNLSGILPLVYALFFERLTQYGWPIYLLFVLLVLSMPVTFVLRDVIFGGRSLGKRLFGLTVVCKKTGKPLSVGARILRNLFFFIYPVDGMLLLITGESIGERITESRVIPKKDLHASAPQQTF